jgi:signal transduction histidine kinase
MGKAVNNWYIIQSIILLSTGIIVFYGFMLYRAILSYNRRSLELQREMEELRFKQEQLLLQTALEIQEETFQYISMELHDNVSQVLSLAKLHLNCIHLPESTEDYNRLSEVKELVSKSLNDIGTISKSLDSDLIEQHGLCSAIQFEIDQWNRHSPGKFHFETDIEKPSLVKVKALFAFRIVQEALNNTVKYSQAKHIYVKAMKSEDFLQITIGDDGIGFDFKAVYENKVVGKKSGIKNMELRSHFIGGDIKFNARSGRGTTIELFVPLNQEI